MWLRPGLVGRCRAVTSLSGRRLGNVYGPTARQSTASSAAAQGQHEAHLEDPDSAVQMSSQDFFDKINSHHQQREDDPPKGFKTFGNGNAPASHQAVELQESIHVELDGNHHYLSPILLRDACTCPQCVDVSTKQKLFSTIDIPSELRVRADSAATDDGLQLRWTNDIKGYDQDHVTHLSGDSLRSLTVTGTFDLHTDMPRRILWDDRRFRAVRDITYDSYMQDDSVLNEAVNRLFTHGLLFVTAVPDSDVSVSRIAERIGPLKNTFYGMTWDVRSVLDAKNVANTSRDLGFHMDLLYMEQPPHIQLLHCIRSSSAGGASLFTDSFRAAADLFERDLYSFKALSQLDLQYHYNHPASHHYLQTRPVIELRRTKIGNAVRHSLDHWTSFATTHSTPLDAAHICDWIDAISWAPPFQAPWSLVHSKDPDNVASERFRSEVDGPKEKVLAHRITRWHRAARRFNGLIQKPEGIHERMMKPGECVIFDNRRVLHARRAFEAGDAGKERWLRGAYLDKDPYMSKMRVLRKRFGELPQSDEEPGLHRGGAAR